MNKGISHDEYIRTLRPFFLKEYNEWICYARENHDTAHPEYQKYYEKFRAFAKGLGFALGKPLIHIPTVEALAYNLYGNSQVICPIMDARRNQVYTGLYEFHEMKFRVMQDQMAVSIEELIKELNLLGREVIFIGDGIPPYRDIIKEQMKVPYSFAPAHLCRQRAGAVGTLGIEYFKEGKIETATEHQPEYLRLSQAERELKEKMMAKEQN